MSYDLVFFAPARAGGPTSWVRIENGRRTLSGDGVPQVSETAPDRLIVVLPSSEVFSGRVSLATKSDREARQAAPFMIEDDVASPLEDLRVVVGPRSDDGKRWVYGASHALADHWAGLAGACPARRTVFVPDAFAAMDMEDDAVLFADGEDLLLWQPRADIPATRLDTAMAAATLPAILSATQTETLAVSQALTWSDNFGATLPRPRRFPAFDLAEKIAGLPPEALATLPGFLRTDGGESDLAARVKPFRRAAILAGLSLLVWAGFLLGQGFYFQGQRNAIDEAGTALFAASFPDRRVVNPEAQLRQEIRSLAGTGGSDFLALATAVSELAGQVDTVQIDSLRYDRTLNVLNVSATYSEFADFELLNAAANELDIVLEDGGVRQNGGVLNGDFAVRLR